MSVPTRRVDAFPDRIPDQPDAPGPLELTGVIAAAELTTVPVAGRNGYAVELAMAAGLAVLAVSPVLGVCWALGDPNVSTWMWTHLGPDTYHSPAEIAADEVCDVFDPARYDQGRCVVRMQAADAGSAFHFPLAQGGACPLATRFDCARRYGIQQWDQDVPLLQPWWLHNGPAGIGFSSTAGALAGLTTAVTTIALGGRQERRYRFTAQATASGAAGGLVAMDLIRHQDLLSGLAAGTGPVLAGTAVLALAVARFGSVLSRAGAR
jgi:hypothetical protein